MYMFKSSRKNEKGVVTVFTSNAKRAFALAVMNFVKNGYKGSPISVFA